MSIRPLRSLQVATFFSTISASRIPSREDVHQRIREHELDQRGVVVEGVLRIDQANPLLEDSGGRGAHVDDAELLRSAS